MVWSGICKEWFELNMIKHYSCTKKTMVVEVPPRKLIRRPGWHLEIHISQMKVTIQVCPKLKQQTKAS